MPFLSQNSLICESDHVSSTESLRSAMAFLTLSEAVPCASCFFSQARRELRRTAATSLSRLSSQSLVLHWNLLLLLLGGLTLLVWGTSKPYCSSQSFRSDSANC